MSRTIALFVLLFTLSVSSIAQNNLTVAAPAAPNQSVLNALATLPEADALVFLNPPRILNEALPRFLPEKDIANMRQGFEDLKKNVGVDPTKVDYVVLATRFQKPAADLSFQPPEFLLVAGGDFSAESLMTLVRLTAGSSLRDEPYASKTLALIKIDPIAKQAEKNPLLKSFSEMGIVALNQTTLAVGSPGYLKAAVDAAAGTGRINSQVLATLMRDPTVLSSAAGAPWSSFGKTFGLQGTAANPRTPNCDSQLGNFFVAVTMDTTNVMLRGWMNADNPDTAKIMTNLFNGMLAHVPAVPDKAAQIALQSLKLTAEENDVVLRADISQQVLLDYIKEQMKPKVKEGGAAAPAPAATPAKKRTTTRRTRRRTTN